MSRPPHDDWDEHDTRGRVPLFADDPIGFRDRGGHDDSLADEMLDHDGYPEDTGAVAADRPRRRRRSPVVRLVALLGALALVALAAVLSLNVLRPLLPDVSFGGGSAEQAQDYQGDGTGELVVEIPEGAGGGQIAEILATEDVVASASGFTAALQAEPRGSSIQPGTYRMANQMSYRAAIARLLDGNFREITGVTLREGLWVEEVFAILAEATGNEVADYEAVDPATLDLPAAAGGELEGYLFPSTYEFAPTATPQDQLQVMVDQGKRRFADLGIADDELGDIIIKASLVQAEGAFSDDLPRVARVIENRLEAGDLLRFDSTVHFIDKERGRAGTTEAARNSDNPYNTYRFDGLPPGPVNSPGEAAIRAAMEPEPGDWYYFVAVDPSTGETNFAVTWEEHEANVALFQEWCRENVDDTGQC